MSSGRFLSYHPHESNNKAAGAAYEAGGRKRHGARRTLVPGRKHQRAAESRPPTHSLRKRQTTGNMESFPGRAVAGPRPPLRRQATRVLDRGGTAAAAGGMWALARLSMIKLTQQQQLELSLGLPLVPLQLPLDLPVDPRLLRLFAGQAALLHG